MKKLIAIALVAGFATPAFAGSLATPVSEPEVMMPAPAPAPITADWTGFYAGASLGFARTTWDSPPGNGSKTGGTLGLQGGYNVDMGTWVAGAELGFAPGFNQTVRNRDISWGVGARLRAGPKLGDDGRLWGFGSLGLAHVRHKAVGGGDSQSDNGWMAGVGIGYITDNNIIFTGEVLHGRNNGDAGVKGTGVALGAAYRF